MSEYNVQVSQERFKFFKRAS